MLLEKCALQEPKAEPGRLNSHILLYDIFLLYISAQRSKAASVSTK